METFLCHGISKKTVFPELVRSPDGPNYSGFSNLLSKLLVYPSWGDFWTFNYVVRIGIYYAIIIRAQKGCFRNLEKFGNIISEMLTTSLVIYCDEIWMIIKKQGLWTYVLAITNQNVIFSHPRRKFKAMGAMGIFPKFKGIAVNAGLKNLGQLWMCSSSLQCSSSKRTWWDWRELETAIR